MIVVEIYPDVVGEYRWRAKDGDNRKVIADSGEGYGNLGDAERMVERIFGAGTAEPAPSEPVRLITNFRGVDNTVAPDIRMLR
ncbi:YegP family protein [Mycobacteroides chelonae]|jgi:uncharacterized protein YegP (UPF0339 family)|uniref:DUF1508 domain-containing protein n=1 Tax=Mycobacteroides chelonae TaxID=1774 RepID=UPI002DF5C709|nr:YegP family protein [Mycobacteroides chelonae]